MLANESLSILALRVHFGERLLNFLRQDMESISVCEEVIPPASAKKYIQLTASEVKHPRTITS